MLVNELRRRGSASGSLVAESYYPLLASLDANSINEIVQALTTDIRFDLDAFPHLWIEFLVAFKSLRTPPVAEVLDVLRNGSESLKGEEHELALALLSTLDDSSLVHHSNSLVLDPRTHLWLSARGIHASCKIAIGRVNVARDACLHLMNCDFISAAQSLIICTAISRQDNRLQEFSVDAREYLGSISKSASSVALEWELALIDRLEGYA